MKPLSNPILIVSDNPTLPGGLSRMGRDLATLCCTMPEFRVGYLGRGSGNRCKFPFTLYSYPESGQWGEYFIQDAWEDFSRGQEGVIITLDDATRRHWFANPIGLPEGLATFLGPGRNFKKWMYLPLDSVGPNYFLNAMDTDTVLRYDRVLGATEWARDMLVASGRQNCDWLPHGIHQSKFHILNPFKATRSLLDWNNTYIVVGCVMSNQARKDFPEAFHCFARLKAHYGNKFHAWLHTDSFDRYWDVRALAVDYGIGDVLEVTMDMADEGLALRYSACDCTILPSGGEGFGFPIIESMACGTACVVTDYAGGATLVPDDCKVTPIGTRVDTRYNARRAVNSGLAFAEKAVGQIEKKKADADYIMEEINHSVEHLYWNNLRFPWERWLREGLKP